MIQFNLLLPNRNLHCFPAKCNAVFQHLFNAAHFHFGVGFLLFGLPSSGLLQGCQFLDGVAFLRFQLDHDPRQGRVLWLQRPVQSIQMMIDDFFFPDPFKGGYWGFLLLTICHRQLGYILINLLTCHLKVENYGNFMREKIFIVSRQFNPVKHLIQLCQQFR